MDGLLPAVLCDVSFFQSWKGFSVFCYLWFFLGGGRFWGRENSLLVAIIVHDRCSTQRVGTHL